MARLTAKGLVFDTPFGILRNGVVEIRVEDGKIVLVEPAVLRHATKAISLILSSEIEVSEILTVEEIDRLVALDKENQK